MMSRFLCVACLLLSASVARAIEPDPGIVLQEYLTGDPPPTPACHASTIEETPNGLIAAWFGGTGERFPDVGIWVTRQSGDTWSPPVEVANGIQHTQPDGTVHRHPTWNPVLFQYPNGPLMLFYKCGPAPDDWWGMVMSSTDGGITWTTPRRLPEHIDGPVRNKPILLDNGSLLCGSSTEFDGWRVHFEWTIDRAITWQRTPVIHDGRTFGAIQPTILQHPDGRLQALLRNRNGNGKVLSTSSTNNGRTWTAPKETILPNPNSAIDAVTLADGRFLLVYNHTVKNSDSPRGREMMNIAISDDGENWMAAVLLENDPRSEFSYPAVIQSSDGRVHITYTWKRKLIRHVEVDLDRVELRPMDGADWPLAQEAAS